MPTSPDPSDDLLRAAEAAYSGLPLAIEDPTDEELATGVRRFSYSEGGWAVNGRARMEGSAAQLLSIEIRPTPPSETVTASLVKAIPVGRITGSIQTLLALDRARRQGAVASETREPEASQSRRGGKPSVTGDLLRELAEAYLSETSEGKPPHPLGRIAERFGRPEETVRTWLARARKEGWLAPGVKGRAGGEPGPRLLAARLTEQLELGPHPADELLDAKISREARRMKLQNEYLAEEAGRPGFWIDGEFHPTQEGGS